VRKGRTAASFFAVRRTNTHGSTSARHFWPSEIIAAFLLAQMEEADAILRRRLTLWQFYHAAFERLEQAGRIRRPMVPDACQHNAHIYYLVLPDLRTRTRLLEFWRTMASMRSFTMYRCICRRRVAR